ncbi:LemA family protein [Candidatus Gracilibacteria bacterium]|nr:LemA family protein [Candidatus Gracilibacteria bacterium]
MKKIGIILGVIVLGVILVGSYLSSTYNTFIRSEETVNRQWAQVETQYQRRYDLIPNLVTSVKGVLNQEQEVFGAIADARTRYAGASTPDQKAAAANDLESNIGRLLVVVENYPQLRSSETVQTLMAQLEGTENRINVERQRYNDDVSTFNTYFRRIPQRWIGGLFGFTEKHYFEATDVAQTVPSVDLDLTK